MAIAARRGERRGFRWGISRKEREFYKEQLKELDLGLEGAAHHKGRTPFRRTETGHYTADGFSEEAEASPSGRTYGGAGSQDSGEGPGDF